MTDGSLFNLDAYHNDDTPVEPAPEPGPAVGAGAPAMPTRNDAGPKSLYRKYRPQSFAEDDLFGQEHIVNTLRNAIVLDRIAHAYLFCGPRGTGKTTTARLLAKAVNCLDTDPRNRPCNGCDACVAINTGATTDVIEIDAASNRGIDDIRDLRERVKYAPSQLKTKFYIIDEAHQITGAAANAFLKTLEEPPPHTKFVLATTDPEELLQTIVSRCQRFDFRRISLEAMAACLTKVAAAENIEIDDEARTAIARHATGSMRDALGLLDQVAVYRENADDASTQVTVDLVRTVLGISRNERVEQIVMALADKDAGAGLRAVGQAVEAGDDIRQLTRQLVAYLRLLLLSRAGGDADIDEAGKALAARFEIREIAELARLMGDIDFKVKHATISQLPLEVAIVEGALRDQPVSAPTARAAQPAASAENTTFSNGATTSAPERPRASLRDRVRGGGRANPDPRPASQQPDTAPAPAQARNPEPSSPEAAPARTAPASISAPPVDGLHLEAMVDAWPRIRADVKAVNRRIEALLQQIDPVAIAGNRVTLVTPYEFHRNRVNTDEVRLVIEEVIGRIFNEKVTVSCVTRDEATTLAPTQPAPRPAAEPTAATRPESSPVSEPPKAASTEPEPSPSVEDDERTLQAVKNIFDAEEEEK
jgi:DNA polymerase III subunit gamma/tau